MFGIVRWWKGFLQGYQMAYFKQLVPFYVEWVLSADCWKFRQVRILFYFLVVLVDTLCMVFVILDLVSDFGLVRVLCWDFLQICWLSQNWYLFHSVFHLFQMFQFMFLKYSKVFNRMELVFPPEFFMWIL